MFQETDAPGLRYDRELVLRVAARIVVSAILGCTVTEGLYVIDNLRSYGLTRDRIINVITFPGLMITRLFDLAAFTQGVEVPRRGGPSSSAIRFFMLLFATLFSTSSTFLQSTLNCEGPMNIYLACGFSRPIGGRERGEHAKLKEQMAFVLSEFHLAVARCSP